MEQAFDGAVPVGTDSEACDWPEGYGRVICDVVASTSDTAAEMARSRPGSFWVAARSQTAARGRQGKRWVSPEGNFAATLVLRTQAPLAERALRSFSVSLALWRTCVALTGRPEAFALKWPNDVLLEGGKLAGILLESGPDDSLLIGIGVNLLHAPARDAVAPDAIPPVSLLDRTGTALAPDVFLGRLAVEVAASERTFAQGGFAAIRADWLARAARLGMPITARTPRETLTGVFRDVDMAGHLVLETAQGCRRIAAADVFF